MSKVPSSKLFELIKGLRGTEKRYFRIYASRHVIGKQNKYMHLFNTIDKQTNFDEEKIPSQKISNPPENIKHLFEQTKTRILGK